MNYFPFYLKGTDWYDSCSILPDLHWVSEIQCSTFQSSCPAQWNSVRWEIEIICTNCTQRRRSKLNELQGETSNTYCFVFGSRLGVGRHLSVGCWYDSLSGEPASPSNCFFYPDNSQQINIKHPWIIILTNRGKYWAMCFSMNICENEWSQTKTIYFMWRIF